MLGQGIAILGRRFIIKCCYCGEREYRVKIVGFCTYSAIQKYGCLSESEFLARNTEAGYIEVHNKANCGKVQRKLILLLTF
jgi:hypothetical protein